MSKSGGEEKGYMADKLFRKIQQGKKECFLGKKWPKLHF